MGLLLIHVFARTARVELDLAAGTSKGYSLYFDLLVDLSLLFFRLVSQSIFLSNLLVIGNNREKRGKVFIFKRLPRRIDFHFGLDPPAGLLGYRGRFESRGRDLIAF